MPRLKNSCKFLKLVTNILQAQSFNELLLIQKVTEDYTVRTRLMYDMKIIL